MDNDLRTSTFGQPEEKILYGYNNINDHDDRRLRRRTGPDFVRRRRFRTIRRRARLPDRVWSIDEPPLPADPTGHGDPLAQLRDDGDLEGHVRPVLPRRGDYSDRRGGPDGHHERLRRLDPLDGEVLRDADDPLEEVHLDGHLHQDLGQGPRRTHDPTDQAVRFRQDGIQVRLDRDEPARSDLLPGRAAALEGADRRREVLPLRPIADRHLPPRGDLD